MDGAWQVGAVCVVVAVFGTLLKKTSPELSLLLTVALCAAALIALFTAAGDVIRRVQVLVENTGFSFELFAPLLKTLAIAVISKLGSDICRDADHGAAAYLVELSGALAALLCALPLLLSVWEMLQELL